MARGDIKMCKLQARKVAQDVLLFVWFKQGVISEEPKPELSFVPEITAEFLNNLCVLVWIESPRNEYVWGEYLENHFERMTKTPYLFATYFAFASYILIEETKDAYASFVNVLSLVIHFALYCWQETEDKKFLNICVDLFSAFFDGELCEKFEDQGRWKNFNEFLKNQESSKRYNELVRSKKPPNEIFKEFQSRHLESREPYIINDFVLKDIVQEEVENHKKSVSFADFVGEKIKKVCSKSFEEVLKSFLEIDNQLEQLYRKVVGVASGGVESVEDEQSLQEVQDASEEANLTKDKGQSKETKELEVLKDPPKKDIEEEILNQETGEVASVDMASDTDRFSSQDGIKASDPLETQDSRPAPDKSNSLTKENMVKAKALLREMQLYIAQISELVKFLCEDSRFLMQFAETKL